MGWILLVTVLGWSLNHGSALAEGDASQRPRSLPIQLVTTTTVFADLIRNVGGDRVEVTSILPYGADPHVYDPTPREARAVAAADIFFYNGLGLEVWVERLIASAARPDLIAVVLSEGLTPIPGVEFAAHSHAEGDPHFWVDISHAMHYVERVQDALTAFDPAGADVYNSLAADYLEKLADLDAWFQAQVQQIPPERRMLVTYHDAFSYMAKRYGLEMAGFLVRNPDREPSARDMATLITRIRSMGIPAVFAEPQINPKFAESLAAEAGVQVGILYSDALTPEIPTYVEMMRANARTLVEALR